MSKLRFVGLDVHAETIVVAVAETAGEVRSLGGIPNRLESIRKLVHKLGPVQHFASMLRGRSYRLRAVLAAHATGSGMCGDRAQPGADEGKRSGQDWPAGCGEAGAMPPGWRVDRCLGTRRCT